MPNQDPAMVECHIRRMGPTHVNIQGFDYVFQKNKAGRKVCKVLNAGHKNYLLGLKDFSIYDGPTDEEMEKQEFEEQNQDSLLDDAGQGQTGTGEETEGEVTTSAGDTLETTEEPSEGPTGDDDFILKTDGSPFASHSSANTAATNKGLKEHEYSVVDYEDGYAVRIHK